jgi:hypothetical protein
MAQDTPVRPLSRRLHPWKLEDDFLGHERRRDWGAAGRARSKSTRRRLYTSACHVPHYQKQTRTRRAVAAIKRREDRAVRHAVCLFRRLHGRVRSGRASRRPELERGMEGTDQMRFCMVDEQTLTYTSTPAKNPFDGREVIHEVTYERE